MTDAPVAPVLMDTAPPLDGERLRTWSAESSFEVTRDGLARYAAVTRDPVPARLAGAEAAPGYAFVPLTALLFAAAREFTGEGDALPRLVHTHQAIRVVATVRPGDELVVGAAVRSLRPGPVGAVVELAATTARGGELVSEQVATVLFVGSDCAEPFGPEPVAGQPSAAAPGRTAALSVDADHPARYAVASGDRNPIHLDPVFARSAGFPGPIAHGMLTLSLTANLIAARHPDLTRAEELRVEFTRPVFPRDRLTAHWSETVAGGGIDVAFELRNRRRRTVLRGGLLSLRPPS